MRTKHNRWTYFLYPVFALCVAATLPLWMFLIARQFAVDVRIARGKRAYDSNEAEQRIFARKCELKDVCDKREAADFLKRNHMFGEFISLLYLGGFYSHRAVGLYHGGKLVYLACYKPSDEAWFCYAMCSLAGCCVVGGASKCLKQIDAKILTLSLKNARMYEKLGFEQVGCCNLAGIVLGTYGKHGCFRCWSREEVHSEI